MVKNVNVAKAYETRQNTLNNVLNDIDNARVHISDGNNKMGVIPSFSVLPLVTCKNCAECSKHCYACLGNYNFSNVMRAIAENTALVMTDADRVADEINHYLNGSTVIYKYFRFNATGDVFNDTYLDLIIKVANANPWTKFLVFTKNFDLFNDRHDEIPENVAVIFSRWDNSEINNPNNYPIAIVKVNDKTEIPENAYHCSGKCDECLKCWNAKKGTARYFDIH